jgi:predicted small lipoprotein YifL
LNGLIDEGVFIKVMGMKKTPLFGSILMLLLVLVGCGQKGPLYLPQPAKPAADAPKPAPAPAAQQDASGN